MKTPQAVQILKIGFEVIQIIKGHEYKRKIINIRFIGFF